MMFEHDPWPDIFKDPGLIKTRNHPSLAADVLVAWANCHMGKAMGYEIPKNFGTVLVEVGETIGMKKAATAENVIEYAREMGWSGEEKKNDER